MRVTILGCGAAGGVPSISAGWGACDPSEPRNRRRRPSILVEEGGTRLLIDASPDLREQLLDSGVTHLDGVVITHAHADHTHGIDDLREVNRVMKGPLDLWAMPETLDALQDRFGYCFSPPHPEATSIYKPLLRPRAVEPEEGGAFAVGALTCRPFPQSHGWDRSLGLRIGPLAYSTDVVALPESAFAVLEGIGCWIVDCFSLSPHPTHAHLDLVLEWVQRVQPCQTVLTHMGPGVDFQGLAGRLPPGVIPAHDGLVLMLE